jgi:hypothetical protein
VHAIERTCRNVGLGLLRAPGRRRIALHTAEVPWAITRFVVASMIRIGALARKLGVTRTLPTGVAIAAATPRSAAGHAAEHRAASCWPAGSASRT